MAKGRAWANLFILGSTAKAIEEILQDMKLGKDEQATLSLFKSRNQ
jgi:hypothetical protein